MIQSHCVLVVEDNRDVRETLVELLETHGYEAVGAEDGRDAFEKLRALPQGPCVIVLDLMMPVMDGRAFREQQRRQPELSDVPVVIITAYDDPQQRVADLDAAAYLRKPLNLKELLRVIQRYCPAHAPS